MLSLAVVASAAGDAVSPDAAAGPPAAAPAAITGTLHSARGLPLPDQIVAIGAAKTTSDGDGRFSFASAPARYDLVIASPDRALATVYEGLTRRDPVIVFGGARASAPKHHAQITVTLVDADATLAAPWQVHFVSPRAFASAFDQRAAGPDRGKSRNPETLTVTWDGADTIPGVVMAHAMKVKNLDIPLAQFAQQAVTLRDGQPLAIDLHLTRTPIVRRPSPRIDVPKEDPGFDPLVFEEYRLPGAGFAMKGPGAVSRAYDIPDLTGFGVELCDEGVQWNPYLHSRRVQCGGPPGKRTVLALPPPSVFKSPAWDTVAKPGLTFTWKPIAGAVYALSLENNGSDKPTAAQPHVMVFTARATAAWPDLRVVGVGFPKPLAVYAATVRAYGPFASIDDLAGPHGLAELTPRDQWCAESKELSIPVRAPLGKEEAACKFKETVMCDGDSGGSPIGEFYRLSALNRTIQTYPDFAAAVKIHCVRDCAGARAYLKAYAQYRDAHPGFDSEEPLPVSNPDDEPEPPPEMFEGKKRAFSGDD